MTAGVREMIVESEKYSMKLIINVTILMNALTLPADQMKFVLTLKAVIIVSLFVLLAINPTKLVKLLKCSNFLF